MKKSFAFIIFVLLISNLVFCKNQKKVTPPDWYYDVLRIKSDLSSYSSMREVYNQAAFDELEKDILEGKLSRVDCLYRLKKIFSDYHIGHIYLVQTEKEKIDFMMPPLSFYCYGDQYHVEHAVTKYEKYLGWKLKAINGFTPEEAIDMLSEYISYETIISKKYFLENLLAYNDYKYAGLLDKKGRLCYELEAPDGKTELITCSFVNFEKSKYLPVRPEIENKTHPKYKKQKNYSITPCPEKATLYIPYNACREMEGYTPADWFSDILKELDSGLYSTIVFDLRYNRGGFDLTSGLLEQNKARLSKYNIALVAGGRSFSASGWFINSVLTLFPDAKLFGEEMGQAVFNYTGDRPETLKKLKCEFWFPLLVDDLEVIKKRADNIYRGIMPDVEVSESYEAFMQGEDAIYTAIYAYFNK